MPEIESFLNVQNSRADRKTIIDAPKLAKELDVPLSSIYLYTRNGEIPFIKIGRHYRYDLNAVLARLGFQA